MDPDQTAPRGAVWAGSTLFAVSKNRFEEFARIFSRRHKQMTFSDAGFLGILRVKVIVHVIIIDQWNQIACLYEIQVTVIYSSTIFATVRSECHVNRVILKTWPRVYKTFFMLNSAEHEICPAYKSQITNNSKVFPAKHSWARNFLC